MANKRAGPPTKAQQLKNREERAKVKAVEEKIKAKELLCSNYHTYMELLHKIATNTMGDGRDVTIPAQATTLKTLIQIHEDLFKQELEQEEEGVQQPTTQPSTPLISLSFKEKAVNN